MTEDRPIRDARLILHFSQEGAAAIACAAAIHRPTVAEFASHVLLRAAEEAMGDRTEHALTDRDRGVFLQMLQSEADPSDAMMQAANRWRSNRDH